MSEIYQPEEDSYLMSDVLKKEIPSLLNENKNLRVLEIGSGSGIQLEQLRKLGVKYIIGSDINSDAVSHCKKLGFNCIKSNLSSKVKGRYNIIIFNPPYLPEDSLEPKSSRLSTTGGKKGSEIINKFLQQSKKHLTKDGRIFILTSSLTKGIKWSNYNKKLIAEKKIFFEELMVWELVKFK